MIEQDHFSEEDCVYIANLAIAALKNGSTSRDVEKAIRAIRLPMKEYYKDMDDLSLKYRVGTAIVELQKLGGANE